MLKIKLIIFVICLTASICIGGRFYATTFVKAEAAQTSAASVPPTISSWKQNRNGATGYNGIAAAVQQVRYSANFVYVNSTSIPTYSIGPWTANPNTPTNQGFLFKIPRNPTPQTGTHTSTPLGAIAFWTDGVAIFNTLDGFSYNNQNIWHQDAVVNEGISFDSCQGHPAPSGVYHHHENPNCLYNLTPTGHSPIIGYAFDGYPIYGAYANANADGTGGIKRMTASYRLRTITDRTTLPNGTVLTPGQYGPALTAKALGTYIEDYEYAAGLGDLDEYNGRFAVTPEYPGGIYAYYVTIYANGTAAYPYYIGPSYYGTVANENITSHGHVTLTETVTTYIPNSVFSDFDGDGKADLSVFRPSNSVWYISKSSNSTVSNNQWGIAADKIVPADYDGDGKTDYAVFRDGFWYILLNGGGFQGSQWGSTGDIAVPADYDGDGKADLAVFRNGTWFVLKSGGGTMTQNWGSAGDIPVVADYDNDGKADFAVYRNGIWYVLFSTGGNTAIQWGIAGDKTVTGDYNGDGKADYAVFRNGFWYILYNGGGFQGAQWGTTGDLAAPADYDGDGKTDLAVFRNGVWYIQRTTAGVQVFNFGSAGDKPVANAFVP